MEVLCYFGVKRRYWKLNYFEFSRNIFLWGSFFLFIFYDLFGFCSFAVTAVFVLLQLYCLTLYHETLCLLESAVS